MSSRRRMILRVLFWAFVLLVIIPLTFAHVMTAPTPRQPVTKAPALFTEISLTAEDGLRLRAWEAKGDPGKAAAVVVHGLGDSLDSFVETATTLHARGHGVILVDLRGHGGSADARLTLGAHESRDVRAAMARVQGWGKGILLVGHSLGSMAVLLAAQDRPEVAGVIVEAPFDTYRDTIAHHGELFFHLPRWVPLHPIAIQFAEWGVGFDADEIDGVRAASRIRAPLLTIVDGADPRMTEAIVRRVYDAHPGPKRLWVAPGADHVGAILHPDYWKVVRGFLDENHL